jgi:hypothetical protein
MGRLARHLWISSVLVMVALACGTSGTDLQRGARDWDAERRRMVEEQLRARDIRSAQVLDVMLRVPRHLFVPESQRAEAYSDSPLPIGYEQTILRRTVTGTETLSTLRVRFVPMTNKPKE